MKCEWHNGFKEAPWWAETIFGLMSWCCEECLERVGKKDDAGKFIAMPAAEKLKQLHPEQPASCGWDQK
jgi:hypothetical protein